MAGQDFTAEFTSGAALAVWEDPARPPDYLYVGDPGAPSRLNPLDGYPHRRFLGTIGTPVEITATVGGVAGEIDTNLGGRLFTASFVERPPPVIGFTHPAGQSSVQSFTPQAEGHHAVLLTRAGGGSVIMHIDVGV